VEQVIAPALARGDWVLCDRFTDATFAYQGGGHGVPQERIAGLERFLPANCRPDVTILFDVPIEVSRERLERGRAKGRDLDKFEREESAFFARVRAAYLERAAREPGRFRVVNAARPMDEVRSELARLLEAL
jgi:dTMP kinase